MMNVVRFTVGVAGILSYSAASPSSLFATGGMFSALDVEESLLTELTSNFRPGARAGRLEQLEAAVKHMFAAVPKNANGNLGHATVRYVLHRLFVEQHGWYIRGLEPDGGSSSSPEESSQRLAEWVPAHLQAFLEQRQGDRGFDLRELVALAAALEDLVHREAIERLKLTYTILNISVDAAVSGAEFERVLETFMLVYLRNGNFSADSRAEALHRVALFKTRYPGWPDVEEWLAGVAANASEDLQTQSNEAPPAAGKPLEFNAVSRVVEAIGESYGHLNDRDCASMKSTLLEMEDGIPGRVSLASFYRKALFSHWHFNEKVEYLRVLGALDEDSEEGIPYIIVPNYVGSRPQCLEASHLYAVCCRNACEDLMTTLEQDVAGPSGEPGRLAEMVAGLSSETVKGPRTLADGLVNRLHEIAASHGGQVPLHGRLFAQWMHHAFPRDCPFPHQAGTTNPQTPDEWMRETGHVSTEATEEEMETHCRAPPRGVPTGDLFWSSTEELLADHTYQGPLFTMNGVVRALVLSVAVLGIASFLRLVVLRRVDNSDKFVPKAALEPELEPVSDWSWLALTGGPLFIGPLLIISIDFFWGAPHSNAVKEFLLCGFLWGVVAIGGAVLRAKGMMPTVEVPESHSLSKMLRSNTMHAKCEAKCFV